MSTDKYRPLLKKLLKVSRDLVTGLNKAHSPFAAVLEGAFRRDYVAALAILRLSEKKSNPVSPFGDSCMALTRRLIEDVIGVEYMLFKGKGEQAKKFEAFESVESKQDLEFLRAVGIPPSEKAQTIIEENYAKAKNTHFKSEKDLLNRRSWAGKDVELMIVELADAGLLSDLEKLSIAQMYRATSRRVHFSPSGVLEYLYQELFADSNRHNLSLSIFITTSALSRLAMRFVSEVEVDNATRQAVIEVWREATRTKPSKLEN